MKKYSKFITAGLVLLFLLSSLMSCRVHHHHKTVVKPSGKVPPGHAKKMTGSKSAKHYAPGQRKK